MVTMVPTHTMSTGREIRCYDYVNHPYEQVRDALIKDPLRVFQAATRAAASRAQSIASELRVDLGGMGFEADIVIEIKKIEEQNREIQVPITRIELGWRAAKMPALFPLMNGELAIYALTGSETQLDFRGVYEPPLGALGKALDAIAGHRIAEVSVHRFVDDVAGHLRRTLG